MAWLLQTPDAASPKLIARIIGECKFASGGGAAFAFASATGVKLLTGDPGFQEFLKSSKFLAVIGLDAITDTNALDALRQVRSKYPNFNPMLFLHDIPATCFHPKTVWLRTKKGGVTITGSGNLTSGGLQENWEALCVETLSTSEIDAVEAIWKAWLSAHKECLLGLDDPVAVERAESNKAWRVRVARALERRENEGEADDTIFEEITEDLALYPILIAEVPRSGDRWNQINFDVRTYQQFFGVTVGRPKTVRFYNVKEDGSLGPEEERHAVEVKSRNYRFEVGAAHGLLYPQAGNPLVIFRKIAENVFNYVLLMPGQPEHTLVQKFIDDNYVPARGKQRITITAGELQRAWPTSPLFS